MKQILLLASALLLPLPALAEVAVSAPWARASILAARPGAAYLTLESTEGDRLIGAATPVADHVMIHAVATDQAGVGRMVHLEALDLPPSQAVRLAPGSMHLMLMGLRAKLEESATFPLTLTFETAGEITVEVPVLGVAAMGPGGPGE